MSKLITINIGEMAVSHNDTSIRTGSIGSCVVVVLYDAEAKVGGMAHTMLPSRKRRDEFGDEAPAKYAYEAVDRLIAEIEKIGGRKKRLKAKLIGGARMFKILSGDKYGIGYQNLEAAKQRLKELDIPLDGEDTGGSAGKIAELNLQNGLVAVETKI